MRHIALFFSFTLLIFGQAAPTIRNITNAAIPALDSPASTIHLAPRSLATIFGFGLADVTASAPTLLPVLLGGTEVHFATDSCHDISCDLIAQLIYVSDQQINFVVPESGTSTSVSYRVVFIRDGQRMDKAVAAGPGRLIIDSTEKSVIFAVGSDCLFSFSGDPASCIQHQALIGAEFDAISGQHITSNLPVHQGQLLTLWLTALSGGVKLNSTTGLLQQDNPATLRLGVAQSGQDFPATIASGPIGGFQTPVPLFAGESPQFVGLDQINVAFPTCTNVPVATSERRYDAFFSYRNVETGNTVRIYMPFLVRIGDPDCTWPTNSITTITSNANPSVSGNPLTLTARVTPSDTTGTVTFMDGTIVLADVLVSSGTATFTRSALSTGNHSIAALYNGDANYTGSAATMTQIVSQATTTTINSSPNPSGSGQPVTFSVAVSTSPFSSVEPSGTVTFYDGKTMLGMVPTTPGIKPVTVSLASLTISALSIGTHLISATFDSGDGRGYASSTSPILAQMVTR